MPPWQKERRVYALSIILLLKTDLSHNTLQSTASHHSKLHDYSEGLGTIYLQYSKQAIHCQLPTVEHQSAHPNH
jgi:hypothetical protein